MAALVLAAQKLILGCSVTRHPGDGYYMGPVPSPVSHAENSQGVVLGQPSLRDRLGQLAVLAKPDRIEVRDENPLPEREGL
jgi:hypothetical protein